MRHLKTAIMALAIILMAAATSFADADANANAMVAKPSHTGKVIEATTSGPYTYINVDENGNTFWIAAPTTYVLEGKTITFEEDLWMPNFKSKALDRTFDRILFVTSIYVHKAGEKTAPKAKAKVAPKKKAAKPATPAKDAGTFTVEDVYGKLGKLDGNIITVKGKVVKVSKGILGRDWVHVQDGTGEEGSTNNLVFRTAIGTSPNVDDEVTATGRLEADKDFGMGYFYKAIVEDSVVTK